MKKIFVTFIFLISLCKGNSQDLIPFEKDKLWGYKDANGNVKIEPQYDYALNFTFHYGVVLRNDSVGAIDENNHIVIPIKYDFVLPLDSSEFLFGYRAKYFGEYLKGIIAADQRIKIPPVYRDITKRNGCYEVRRQQDSIISGNLRSIISFYGLLDVNGKTLIPCDFDYLSWLNDFLLDISKGNNHALFNKNGQQLTDFVYLVIGKPNLNGLCKVRVGDKYGFITTDGKVHIPIDLDFCEEFKNGFSIIKKKGKWGAIDKNGKKVIEPKHEYEEIKALLKRKSETNLYQN